MSWKKQVQSFSKYRNIYLIAKVKLLQKYVGWLANRF